MNHEEKKVGGHYSRQGSHNKLQFTILIIYNISHICFHCLHEWLNYIFTSRQNQTYHVSLTRMAFIKACIFRNNFSSCVAYDKSVVSIRMEEWTNC